MAVSQKNFLTYGIIFWPALVAAPFGLAVLLLELARDYIPEGFYLSSFLWVFIGPAASIFAYPAYLPIGILVGILTRYTSNRTNLLIGLALPPVFSLFLMLPEGWITKVFFIVLMVCYLNVGSFITCLYYGKKRNWIYE